MDNQHKLISGYRDLTATEIEKINAVKQLEALVLQLVTGFERELVEHSSKTALDHAEQYRMLRAQPHRWLAIARTDLQTGFMAFVRAIAMPQPTELNPVSKDPE